MEAAFRGGLDTNRFRDCWFRFFWVDYLQRYPGKSRMFPLFSGATKINELSKTKTNFLRDLHFCQSPCLTPAQCDPCHVGMHKRVLL